MHRKSKNGIEGSNRSRKTGKVFNGLLVGLLVLSVMTGFVMVEGKNIEPSDEKVVDDFEDNDLSEYTAEEGTVDDWTIQSSTVFEGDYALESISDDSSYRIVSDTGDGLNYYPEAGDKLSVRIYLTGVADSGDYALNVRWADQDHAGDGYSVTMGDYGMELERSGGDISNELLADNTTIDLSDHLDEWLKLTVDWQTDGTMVVTLEAEDGTEIGTMTGSDTTYSSGGIGFRDRLSEDTFYIDNYTVEGEDEMTIENWTDLYNMNENLGANFELADNLNERTEDYDEHHLETQWDFGEMPEEEVIDVNSELDSGIQGATDNGTHLFVSDADGIHVYDIDDGYSHEVSETHTPVNGDYYNAITHHDGKLYLAVRDLDSGYVEVFDTDTLNREDDYDLGVPTLEKVYRHDGSWWAFIHRAVGDWNSAEESNPQLIKYDDSFNKLKEYNVTVPPHFKSDNSDEWIYGTTGDGGVVYEYDGETFFTTAIHQNLYASTGYGGGMTWKYDDGDDSFEFVGLVQGDGFYAGQGFGDGTFDWATQRYDSTTGDTSSTNYRVIRTDFSAIEPTITSEVTETYSTFHPLGHEADNVNSFTGTFEGNGYTIKGLDIFHTRGDKDNIGMFGKADNIIIKNLTLSSTDVTSGGIRTGLLVGNLEGDSNYIENCSVSGGLENTQTYSNGGVIGRVGTWVNISRVSSDVSINVSASGDDGHNAGGIAGMFRGELYDSYSRGYIDAGDTVGGLIGQTATPSVTNSYSTVSVTGDTDVGSLIGDSGATITDSFALEDSENNLFGVTQTDHEEIGRVSEANQSDMKSTELYTKTSLDGYDDLDNPWDFVDDHNDDEDDEDIWDIDENSIDNDGYPYLNYETFESSVSVLTDSASSITSSSASLTGDITDMGGESSVDAYFDYRKTGTDTWSSTSSQSISSTGEFSIDASGLDRWTEYEYKAIVDDGTDLTEGSIKTFRTTNDDATVELESDTASWTPEMREWNGVKEWNLTVNETTTATITLHNLTADTSYDIFVNGGFYDAESTDSEGDMTFTYDQWSTNTFEVTQSDDINPPTDAQIIDSGTDYHELSWTNSTNADYTYIERNTSETWSIGEATEVYNSTGESYNDTGLDSYTNYYYQLWAYNETQNTYSADYDEINETTDSQEPDEPTNPLPSDGATDVQLEPTLSVDVSHPDGLDMDVTFYNASDDSVIGTDSDVPDEDTASVTWNGADNYNTTYSWYTIADDGTDINQSNTWSFTTIEEPESYFDVTVFDTNSPVSEGNDLSVDIQIDNTGDVEDTQTIELLDFEGTLVNSTSVTLSSGDSTTETLVWETEVGDGEETNDITVQSDDDADTQEVTIEYIQYTLTWNIDGGGNVTIDGAEYDVGGNENFDRDTVIDINASSDYGWQWSNWSGDLDTTTKDTDITMDSDKGITANFDREEFDLTISSDDNGTTDPSEGTYSYEYEDEVSIEAIPNDNYTFKEWTGDNGTIDDTTSDDTTIQMLDDYTITAEFEEGDPAYFEVTIVDTNSPIVEDEDLNVEVKIENMGDLEGTQDIELLDFESDVQDSSNITLDGGEQITVTLVWTTSEDMDVTTDDITVQSEDTQDVETITIEEYVSFGTITQFISSIILLVVIVFVIKIIFKTFEGTDYD